MYWLWMGGGERPRRKKLSVVLDVAKVNNVKMLKIPFNFGQEMDTDFMLLPAVLCLEALRQRPWRNEVMRKGKDSTHVSIVWK